MSNTEAHVALLKDAYGKWSACRGESYDMWKPIITDGCRLRSAGGGPDRPEYFQAGMSQEAIIEYFEGLARDWKMIHFQADEFVAERDRVVVWAVCEWQNRRTGKTFRSVKIDFWRFRDGKPFDVYESFDTAAMVAAMQA